MHAGITDEGYRSARTNLHLPPLGYNPQKCPDNRENESYPGAMRGGLERWKRGADSRGVRHAIAYAMEGTCDAHLPHLHAVEALENYSDVSGATVSRFIVENGAISSDELTAGGLRVWLTGHDPITGEERGRQRLSPDADLVLDGTINHPKSYSITCPQLKA